MKRGDSDVLASSKPLAIHAACKYCMYLQDYAITVYATPENLLVVNGQEAVRKMGSS